MWPSAAVRTDSLVAVTDAQERFVAACLGELMGEFMLNDDPKVLAARRAQQQALFDAICWKDEQDLHDMVVRGDRAAKIDLVTDAKLRVERVQATLVKQLSAGGARVIAFDATFPTPESQPTLDALEKLQNEVGPDVPCVKVREPPGPRRR